MQLKYRGVSYTASTQPVETTGTELIGTYRGMTWRTKLPHLPPIPDAVLVMRYRGLSYLTPRYNRLAAPDQPHPTVAQQPV